MPVTMEKPVTRETCDKCGPSVYASRVLRFTDSTGAVCSLFFCEHDTFALMPAIAKKHGQVSVTNLDA